MKIGIISPDAVKLPLMDSAPEIKIENGESFSLRDKCARATALGRRAQRFAEVLSKKFDVTLLVPNLNHPGDKYIEKSAIKYTVDSYLWNQANWKYSEELNAKLIKFDIVIIQTTTGTGFKNCAALDKSIRVVCDAWVPFPVEFPWALQSYSDEDKKQYYWKLGLEQYKSLMERSDCILYANDRQKSFYDGLMMSCCTTQGKALKNITMIKVPLGMDDHRFKQNSYTKELKLLWWGPIYPWYDVETLLAEIDKIPGVRLTFSGVEHPRFKKLFINKYQDLFNQYKNIEVSPNFTENFEELFDNYDFGVIFGKDSLENFYSHRCRIVDMISCGLPIITDSWNSFINDPNIGRAMYSVDTKKLGIEFKKLVYNFNLGKIPCHQEIFHDIRRNLSWDVILESFMAWINE